jgi:hypothetical protein
MHTAIEEIPRIDPCEKSRPPIVIIKNTPVAEIITTYACDNTNGKLETILQFVKILKIIKITNKPAIGKTARKIFFLFIFPPKPSWK